MLSCCLSPYSGGITQAELKQIMQGLNENISDADLAEMIRLADPSGKGSVSFADFEALLLDS